MRRKDKLLELSPAEAAVVLRCEFSEVAGLAAGARDAAEFGAWLAGWADDRKAAAGAYERPTVCRAADRMRDMLQYEGETVTDLSTGEQVRIRTFEILRNALNGDPEADGGSDFLLDMLYLLRALAGRSAQPLARARVRQEARRWDTGLDERVIRLREQNKRRIIEMLVERVELRSSGQHKRYVFPEGASDERKRELVGEWWNDFRFQLAMAIRSPRELNRCLGHSLSSEVMQRLARARAKGMPFFITPYYASLLDVTGSGYDDLTIRSYVIYSGELVDAYGGIRAWEREDEVREGEPNAAGWVLPEGGNVHRRYPDVAILIPDSMGRACGGLCAPCQRMYDFQRQRLGFEFEKLKPNEHWDAKLRRLMRWFERDESIRDILITGGDGLMSQNATLRNILESVLRMAIRKRRANGMLPEERKRATIDRVRIGTRLPAYLPMKIDDELVEILSDFRRRGQQAGISQFFIQTHFESPLEITPEAHRAITALQSAGWLVTNQLVFTVAASRRGQTACLRRMLTRQGVVSYYTFSVKGFEENYDLFTPNSRSLQEAAEEKPYGLMSRVAEEELMKLLQQPERLQRTIVPFLRRHSLPFISTDRNVLNLPGIGKSMTFTTIGVTSQGKRILRFDHDRGRLHSPLIDHMGEVCITESKSIAAYLRQLQQIGERPADYASIWDYSRGQTEPRFKVYEYPTPAGK